MTDIARTGPYASLPATARRLGRGGLAFAQDTSLPGMSAGDYLGTISAVTWSVSADQVAIPIPGQWRNHSVPGMETRSGTLRYQDVDDYFRMLVYNFFKARDNGDFAAQPPSFAIQTVLVGGPEESIWTLFGCQVYGYDGGYANSDDLLERELAFTFERESPSHAFQYVNGTDPVTHGQATQLYSDT